MQFRPFQFHAAYITANCISNIIKFVKACRRARFYHLCCLAQIIRDNCIGLALWFFGGLIGFWYFLCWSQVAGVLSGCLWLDWFNHLNRLYLTFFQLLYKLRPFIHPLGGYLHTTRSPAVAVGGKLSYQWIINLLHKGLCNRFPFCFRERVNAYRFVTWSARHKCINLFDQFFGDLPLIQ